MPGLPVENPASSSRAGLKVERNTMGSNGKHDEIVQLYQLSWNLTPKVRDDNFQDAAEVESS